MAAADRAIVSGKTRLLLFFSYLSLSLALFLSLSLSSSLRLLRRRGHSVAIRIIYLSHSQRVADVEGASLYLSVPASLFLLGSAFTRKRFSRRRRRVSPCEYIYILLLSPLNFPRIKMHPLPLSLSLFLTFSLLALARFRYHVRSQILDHPRKLAGKTPHRSFISFSFLFFKRVNSGEFALRKKLRVPTASSVTEEQEREKERVRDRTPYSHLESVYYR